MYQYLFSFFLFILLLACQPVDKQAPQQVKVPEPEPDRELIYHYSIWSALVNEVYDGELTIAELKKKGDVGLGTYNGLDGEMVMLDGVLYQIGEDGHVGHPDEGLKIPYTNITWFEPDIRFTREELTDYSGLMEQIAANFQSGNYFYAFKIRGLCQYIKCGTIRKQEIPYTRTLAELISERPVFEKENVMGTFVGFYCPEFVGNVNTPGFHLHFISDDRTFGGHVMEFKASKLEIQMDLTPSYRFDLPQTEAYATAALDQEFEYGK